MHSSNDKLIFLQYYDVVSIQMKVIILYAAFFSMHIDKISYIWHEYQFTIATIYNKTHVHKQIQEHAIGAQTDNR